MIHNIMKEKLKMGFTLSIFYKYLMNASKVTRQITQIQYLSTLSPKKENDFIIDLPFLC